MYDTTLDIYFRFVKPSDVEELRALYEECFPVSYPDSWFQDLITKPCFIAYVALVNDRIIGILVAKVVTLGECAAEDRKILDSRFPLSSHVAYILSLGVTEAYRSNGIALQLQSASQNHASHGVQNTDVSVLPTSPSPGCPLSPFLFNFVIDEIMRRTLEGLRNHGVQIACEENLVDLEYADDIVLMFEEEEKAQVFLDELTKVIPSFGMHFAPTKCKVMLVDVQSLNTPLTIQGEVLEVVERFTYLGSCISSDCSVTDEVNARICKARAAFANLRHLWRQNGLSLNLKGRVYQATVRVVLFYGCETWLIRAADLRRLQAFDNRCLRTIARVGWCRRIRNEAVRKRVFGCVTGTSIEECVQHQKLRWLGHVLRMSNHRLPKRVLFSMPNSEWRKQRGDQPMSWQRSMKEITKRLGTVGATRLPGWGPHDPHFSWLETLQDMAANRYQWRSCCQFLSRLLE
ncbi:hypothetical protein T265_03797 [Opisthorchis viverrini]|uniref:Reverse transcriptase domain-containing protein n=1 Tax=Opisthorchis viverrini TaxID=6198 RepID=A0A074ZR58_OPIVI|nr:hypothetical protein T265_03797 [Opisthorchis viverrini]KER29596.1 hypothetical protein T265_03797 [Opisthorchis viverrini]